MEAPGRVEHRLLDVVEEQRVVVIVQALGYQFVFLCSISLSCCVRTLGPAVVPQSFEVAVLDVNLLSIKRQVPHELLPAAIKVLHDGLTGTVVVRPVPCGV